MNADACPQRSGTAANHCWHLIRIDVYGQTVERCCFCGRERTDERYYLVGVEHGPYEPARR